MVFAAEQLGGCQVDVFVDFYRVNAVTEFDLVGGFIGGDFAAVDQFLPFLFGLEHDFVVVDGGADEDAAGLESLADVLDKGFRLGAGFEGVVDGELARDDVVRAS